MKFSQLHRVTVLFLTLLAATLVSPAASPPPTAASASYADFDKPATVFTGPATVTCFTSPDSSYLVIRDLLRKTQSEMLIMVYAFTNWFLIREIHDALQRNSSMQIKIIVSWKWASPSERKYTKGCFYNLSQTPAFGNNLQLYFSESDLLEFTHAKFMVLDREVVIVESCNWAKSGVPPKNSTGNREWGVAIRQPDVVNYFVETFTHDLSLPNVEPYTPDSGDKVNFSESAESGSYPAPFENKTFTGSMSIQCVLSPDNDINAIKALIQSATSTLDVQQMYIREDWNGYPNQFLQEILAARARGVTCRVILDAKDEDNEPVAELLVQHGVGVAWQDFDYWGNATGEPWLHNKGVIVDGEKVLISSINWSNESVSQNREAGVIITHSGVADFFSQVFQWDWEHAEYIGGLENVPPTTPTLNDPGDTDSDGSFTVSWSASTDPDGYIDHYQLQMSDSSSFTTILQEWTVNATSYDVTGLSDGVYYFRVRAVDNGSAYSLWSNTESITVAISTTTTTTTPISTYLTWAGIAALVVAVVVAAILRLRRSQGKSSRSQKRRSKK